MTSPGKTSEPAALLFDGSPLLTSEDAARFLGVRHNQLLHTLYRAPEEERYKTFEIPKRTGGMREISAPKGLLRDLQYKVLEILTPQYDAHPGAHGFILERGILTNASEHVGQRLVLNVDLKDFFPSINFGRVRGLFLSKPFAMGPASAAIFAQICTHKNGLPQGAPTSPILSNFIATELDRRLTKLARQNRMRYSRYADDITLSTNATQFPVSIVAFEQKTAGAAPELVIGEALDKAIAASGFAVNPKKVRMQGRSERQSVTGLNVNDKANVARSRIRQLRAMIHAWSTFGLEAAAAEHFRRYRGARSGPARGDLAASFRNVVYGNLAFVKMVRGASDPVFLKLCARLLDLDPNPSKFIRQMVFGADDFDIFISHASEDREAVARPILEACNAAGLKAFLDDEHIAWGENFTQKINTALGAARTVLTIISPVSVTKDWPMAEVNTALTLEVAGKKNVLALIVGKPDLSKLPLISGKDFMLWTDNPDEVAQRLKAKVRPVEPAPAIAPPSPGSSLPPRPRPAAAVPSVSPPHASQARSAPSTPAQGKGWFKKWFG